MRPLAKEYKQVEIILECSALSMLNLSEVYSSAQQVVLYPSSPLYNSVTKELTNQFKSALKLIFRRCDSDKDFFLNDKEIKNMHAEIFHTSLGDEEVDRIKEVIKHEDEETITDCGMTLKGFFALQKMIILRLKINVCWTLLRHYGFNDDLCLNIEFSLNKNQQQSVELSRATILYLKKVFDQYSKGQELSFGMFSEIFSTTNSPP